MNPFSYADAVHLTKPHNRPGESPGYSGGSMLAACFLYIHLTSLNRVDMMDVKGSNRYVTRIDTIGKTCGACPL